MKVDPKTKDNNKKIDSKTKDDNKKSKPSKQENDDDANKKQKDIYDAGVLDNFANEPQTDV